MSSTRLEILIARWPFMIVMNVMVLWGFLADVSVS
jgi:hypothetical protein